MWVACEQGGGCRASAGAERVNLWRLCVLEHLGRTSARGSYGAHCVSKSRAFSRRTGALRVRGGVSRKCPRFRRRGGIERGERAVRFRSAAGASPSKMAAIERVLTFGTSRLRFRFHKNCYQHHILVTFRMADSGGKHYHEHRHGGTEQHRSEPPTPPQHHRTAPKRTTEPGGEAIAERSVTDDASNSFRRGRPACTARCA